MNIKGISLSTILEYGWPVIAGIFGWITHRLGKRLPASWVRVVTNLNPEDIDHLVIAVGTRKGREALVREAVYDAANQRGVELSDKELGIVIDRLNQAWRAGMKFAAPKKV